MEQDEFNDFQHPVSQQPQKSHQLAHQTQRQTKEQGDSFAQKIFDFDAKNVNPSSSLATMTFQQLSDKKDSKDFEDNNWPHLYKIQSQNLPALEQNLITFQKSYSQQEHKIDLFDFSSTFISQNKAVKQQDINKNKEQPATLQIQNIELTQNSKAQQNFLIIDSFQPSPNQINLALQNNLLGFQNDFLSKEKPTEQIQFSQQNDVLTKENQTIANVHVQSDNFRKQSDQFVFAQPVQPVSFQANNVNERKQSEQFVFQSQQKRLQTFFSQAPSNVPQLVILEQEYKLANFVNLQQEDFSQPKIINELTLSTNEQENNIMNPIIATQSVKVAQNDQEEDQFGNFEETVPNTYTQSPIATQGTQMKSENQQCIVQLYEEQIPFGVDSSSKKKELQELIDALPNYNLFFVKAFQSF